MRIPKHSRLDTIRNYTLSLLSARRARRSILLAASVVLFAYLVLPTHSNTVKPENLVVANGASMATIPTLGDSGMFSLTRTRSTDPLDTGLAGESFAYYGLTGHSSGQCTYSKQHLCNLTCAPDTFQKSDSVSCPEQFERSQIW